ncbi:MAG: zf-HC2 domain-containing protein [Candidatus Omnitrophota bacterium]
MPDTRPKSRLCPSEEMLGEYLSGVLSPPEGEKLEKHLAGCKNCRGLLADAHHVLSRPGIHETWFSLCGRLKKNLWFAAASALLAASFLFPKYFLQFLAAAFIAGAKWVIDSRTTKMMIMVQEAAKNKGAAAADKTSPERSER